VADHPSGRKLNGVRGFQGRLIAHRVGHGQSRLDNPFDSPLSGFVEGMQRLSNTSVAHHMNSVKTIISSPLDETISSPKYCSTAMAQCLFDVVAAKACRKIRLLLSSEEVKFEFCAAN
jgi:hypothetical protein